MQKAIATSTPDGNTPTQSDQENVIRSTLAAGCDPDLISPADPLAN